MRDISELTVKEDVRYAKDHEWAKKEGNTVKVGISDYAQDQLGDIVFVELPEIGAAFAKGEVFGTVESTKAVSELYMPIGGKVLSVNTELGNSPELVNKDPYGKGWMMEIAADNLSELDSLMDKDDYLNMLKGLKE